MYPYEVWHIFLRGIDILISLSWALSSQQFSDEDSENDQNPYTSVRDNKVVLYEAGYIVNDLIHKEIEKLSTSKKLGLTGDHDLFSLDVDEQLQKG